MTLEPEPAGQVAWEASVIAANGTEYTVLLSAAVMFWTYAGAEQKPEKEAKIVVVVLVIEDEPGIADFLRRGLESAGFVVDMAADGQLACCPRNETRWSSSSSTSACPACRARRCYACVPFDRRYQ